MEKKQRFFIYDRKEAAVLLLLGVAVAIFAFTLGVHLGKRVTAKVAHDASSNDKTHEVATAPETTPSNLPTTPVVGQAAEKVDENLSQALHDEVARTGIKLESPRQVDLPKETRSGNGGATSQAEKKTEKKSSAHGGKSIVERLRKVTPELTGRKFTLQVGSFPSAKEAEEQLRILEGKGIKPQIRQGEVKGKTWYRIHLGGYATREEAEQAGTQYQSKHLIDSFIVAKATQ